jgi:hypothetical protein
VTVITRTMQRVTKLSMVGLNQ